MGDLPELVKAMVSLFGRRWGIYLSRLAVLLALGGLAGGCVAGIDATVSSMSKVTPLSVGLMITLVVTIWLGMMVGIAFAIVLVLRLGLAIPLHKKIEGTLDTTIHALETISTQITSEALRDSLLAMQNIRQNWNTDRITRLVRWLDKTLRKKKEK